ncbi:DNA damage-regulated autophagy modulator protein 1 [Aphelenchoides fujianensis]|nr:DNA damage-regulated autophagy modulator protein 1 [Aphelenchoides fujianensis]
MSERNQANGFSLYGAEHVHRAVSRPQYAIWTSLFPICPSILTLAAFLSGYIIAVERNDEEKWFSFISDGGAVSPESCIFGLLLNFAAFFYTFTLTQYMEFHHLDGCGWGFARWLLLCTGIASGVGVCVVANFQETNVPIAHGWGAWFAFFGGLFYVWTYVIISSIVKPSFVPTFLTFSRGLLALITTIALATHMVTQIAAPFVKEDANGFKPPRPTAAPHLVTRLHPGEPWYLNHLIATISEWVLGVTFQIVILTFAFESDTMHATCLDEEQLEEVADWPELKNIKVLDTSVGHIHPISTS